MLNLLKSIHSPEDLKALSIDELEELAKEVRIFLIQSLSQTGGHLASNLGVVELTIAMHYVFKSPIDQFVWDVGHQAYVHKLLTGRRKGFKHLRQADGMSGFPKRKESPHDTFETGHSSTSISAAQGMAVARDLKGENYSVLAVIGDGALTGGMAFEALNNVGRGNSHMIVILNDNEMSISKNVGGLGKYLNRLRSSEDYLKAKEDIEDVLHKVPLIGEHMVTTIKRTKESVKSFVIENTLFEQLGFTYLGPVDGHNYEELIDILENAKSMKGPVFIHVKTKKGKGYSIAEKKPSHYHGVAPFCIATGESLSVTKSKTFSAAFGEALVEKAADHKEIVAITAAMPEGTGLTSFAKAYPKRFFDVGIAEQHAVTFAAGLAANGFRPVVAVYSTFLQRAYDQVLHDVCLQKLPVVFAIDRAGIVGEDGTTHQGVYDIAFLRGMPHMTILSPKMPDEIAKALELAFTIDGPVAIRYPKGTTNIAADLMNNYTDIGLKILQKGHTIAIIASGRTVETALKVRELLNEKGYDIGVIELPCICPMDENGLKDIGASYDYVFTIEDGIIQGGFGQEVMAYFMENAMPVKGHSFGFKDGLIAHGKVEVILEREQLSAQCIADKMTKIMEKESR